MKTLRARLLLVVSMALVPVLAFQTYTESQARLSRERLVEDEAVRLLHLVSAEQRRIFDGAEQLLGALTAAPSVQENLHEHCQRMLANLLERSPRYLSAAVIGLDGHILCRPGAIDPRIDVSDRDYFRDALRSGGFTVGTFDIGRITGQPSLHLAMPFRNPGGVVAGVVEVALSIDWLRRQLASLALPPGTVVSITDRNGTYLALHPGGGDLIGQPLSDENRFFFAGNEIRVVPWTSSEGDHPRVVAYSPPGADPWGLGIGLGLDRTMIFATVTQANRTGLLLIAGGALLALLMTSVVGTRLVREPVDRLLRVAERWRNGELGARTGLSRQRSEFGRLAVAFEAMAAAQEAREHALRIALESTTDGVMVFDRAWRFTYLNEHAKARIPNGGDMLGRMVWEAFPGSENSPFAEAYRRAMATGVPTQVCANSAALAGFFEAHAYPSKDGLTVFFRDLTEEHRIAAALRQSEALFRAIFDQAAVGIGLVSLDLTWQTVNDSLCAITGWTREEMLGRATIELAHPDDREVSRARARALVAGEIAISTEERRFMRKDGSIVWLNSTVSVLRDADGRPELLIVVAEDVTARVQAEAALRESETRLQLAREAAGFGIWDWNMVDGQAIWSEEKWRQHGYEPRPGAAPQELWLASVHPDDRARLEVEWDVAVATPGQPFGSEYRVVWPDGTVRWLLARGTIVRDAAGRPVRVVGLSMDVTASRETEAALRRLSSDLEERVREEVGAREAAQARAAHAERMQALGQLAGGIAHDFNNVLQGIAGAAALIERRAKDEAGVRRFARLVTEATERGASITRRLLGFGRRADLRAEALDAASVLYGLREILVHTLGAGIDVQVRLGDGLAPLLADKGQLETILVNLATNARDAMPDGGRLLLAAAGEAVSAHGARHRAGLSPGHYVRLTVADTGTGMSAATLARATEPFFTTKKPGAGTGLGLAMAKGFAEQSGGALAIESSPGRGTTVTLWLPEARAERPAGLLAAPAAPNSAGAGTATAIRVLVVDDESLVRETIAAFLESENYAVSVAASGAQALARLQAGETVDALVTDLSMPGMDGLALIRAVHDRLPGLPAILLTGYADDGVALAVDGAVTGSFSLLRKPVSALHLVDRIRALLATPAATR